MNENEEKAQPRSRVERAAALKAWAENVNVEELKTQEVDAPPELIALIEEARRSPTVLRDRRRQPNGEREQH